MFNKIFSILLICLICGKGKTLASDSINVIIIVEGFRNDKGLCRLLLFENSKGFPDSYKDAKLMLNGSIKEKKSEFNFKVIPGEYAISVLHDENLNRKMDKTWYGKPKEGFGVPNNSKVGFSQPKYEESIINLSKKNNHIIIKIKYL